MPALTKLWLVIAWRFDHRTRSKRKYTPEQIAAAKAEILEMFEKVAQ